MKYRKNYKRRSALPRKIIASGLSAAFCAGTVGGSYAGAMNEQEILINLDEIKSSEFSDSGKEDEDEDGYPFKLKSENDKLFNYNLVKKDLLDYVKQSDDLKEFRDFLDKTSAEEILEIMKSSNKYPKSSDGELSKILEKLALNKDLLLNLFVYRALDICKEEAEGGNDEKIIDGLRKYLKDKGNKAFKNFLKNIYKIENLAAVVNEIEKWGKPEPKKKKQIKKVSENEKLNFEDDENEKLNFKDDKKEKLSFEDEKTISSKIISWKYIIIISLLQLLQ